MARFSMRGCSQAASERDGLAGEGEPVTAEALGEQRAGETDGVAVRFPE